MGSCYYQWNNKDIVSEVVIAVFVCCDTHRENAKQKEFDDILSCFPQANFVDVM